MRVDRDGAPDYWQLFGLVGGMTASIRDVLDGESRRCTREENADTSRQLIVTGIVVSNIIGTAVVVILLGVALPLPPEAEQGKAFGGITVVATASAATYVVIAIAVGATVGLRIARPVVEFYRSDRVATEADRRAVRRLPLPLLLLQCRGCCGASRCWRSAARR